MNKCEIRPNTLLYPVPVLMVSSGTKDGRTNIMTAGWTGTIPIGSETAAMTATQAAAAFFFMFIKITLPL